MLRLSQSVVNNKMCKSVMKCEVALMSTRLLRSPSRIGREVGRFRKSRSGALTRHPDIPFSYI